MMRSSCRSIGSRLWSSHPVAGTNHCLGGLTSPPFLRTFSSEVATKPARRGVGIIQRISSFIIGAGLTALGTHFYIWQELQEGNRVLIAKQAAIEERLRKLEK